MSPQRITLPAASARTQTLAEACIRKMTSVSQKPAPRALLPAPGRRKLWTNLTPAATSGLSTAEGAPSHRVPTTPPPGRSGLAINQSVMRSRCFTSSTRPRWTCFAGLSRKPIVKGFSSAMRILAVPICPKAFRPGSRFSSRPCRAGCLSIRPMPENRRDTPSRPPRALSGGNEEDGVSRDQRRQWPLSSGNRLSQNRRSRECIVSPPRQTRRCRFVCVAPAERSPAFSRRPKC